MFIRKNLNKNGSVTISIVDKKGGIYKFVKTLGTSSDPDEINRLVHQGKEIIHGQISNIKQQRLIGVKSNADLTVESFVGKIANESIRTVGPELIFGTLFDRLGFNIVPNELFRHLTIARLVYPTSKLKTVDYLWRYRGEKISVDSIYRFLDTLNKKYKEQVETVAFQNTKKLLGQITVVFYDMTTLYFETEDEDDLRKIGFSKDGKFQQPQIMLGLLVGEGGLPIGYDIFPGNSYEGITLIPTLQKIEAKYGFGKPIVVADAGLLSKDNIKQLGEEKYQFIVGGRIKNESEQIKKTILEKSIDLEDGGGFSVTKPDGTRLIVTHSNKRARKDAYNRERGLKKLRKQIEFGKLTKKQINNRGYNKFLLLEGTMKITVDEDKITNDKQWDGLKGYITNTKLDINKITENYSQLWQIEKAFRISKTDLRVRPIYHYRQRRIEAHICIAFVAYAIYKELERLLRSKKVSFSAERAAELTHNMYGLKYKLPDTNEDRQVILQMDEEQKILYETITQDRGY